MFWKWTASLFLFCSLESSQSSTSQWKLLIILQISCVSPVKISFNCQPSESVRGVCQRIRLCSHLAWFLTRKSWQWCFLVKKKLSVLWLQTASFVAITTHLSTCMFSVALCESSGCWLQTAFVPENSSEKHIQTGNVMNYKQNHSHIFKN